MLEPKFQGLCQLHREHWQSVYSDLTEDEFIAKVCTSSASLPEAKLPPTLHTPICWLGGGAMPSGIPAQRAYLKRLHGWKRLKYLIVMPFARQLDENTFRCLHPETQIGQFMRRELKLAGIDVEDCMSVSLCRFCLPPGGKYSDAHKRAGLPYLERDIRETQPKVVILFGAEVFKAIYGKTLTLDAYRGEVIDLKLGAVETKVIPTVSPYSFFSSHADLGVFRQELIRARQVAEAVFSMPTLETDYRVLNTPAEVEAVCAELKRIKPRHIAFDTEWGNDYAREDRSYTLTVQFAWAAGKAVIIPLRGQRKLEDVYVSKEYGRADKNGIKKTKQVLIANKYEYGIKLHTPEAEARIWQALQSLFSDPDIRLDGHHLRVDIDRFFKESYSIDDKVETGFDTMLVHHALKEDESQGLDYLIRKYMPWFGNYWCELEAWLSANGRPSNRKFGYRNIPTEILLPYALKDADATWRLVEILEKELEAQPKIKKLYWDIIAPGSQYLLEVERHGILVDEDKRMELRAFYKPIYDQTLQKLRANINWPDFNPSSICQMAAFLFSTTIHRQKKPAPAEAKVLALTPLFNTDKRPVEWAKIREMKAEHKNFPGTKSGMLQLLQTQYPDIKELGMLVHLSVLKKFLSTYLKERKLNAYGVWEDGKGFHHNIGEDGRVRTHLSQLTSTGRYTSKKTNLQVSPKKQEDMAQAAVISYMFDCDLKEYKRRTNDGKKNPDGSWKIQPYTGIDFISKNERPEFIKFKDIYMADEGRILVEADFKSAELFVWAYCSGDKVLIDILDSGRDLHAEVACSSFRLSPLAAMHAAVEKLKAGDFSDYEKWDALVKNEYGGFRVSAKAVSFG